MSAPDAGGVREHPLLLGVSRRLVPATRPQYIRVHPRMTTQMVQIHLIIVTNFFLIMPVRIPSENHQIIPEHVGGMERPLPRHVLLPQMLPGIMYLGPLPMVQLEHLV